MRPEWMNNLSDPKSYYNDATPLWTAEDMAAFRKSWDRISRPPPESMKYVCEVEIPRSNAQSKANHRALILCDREILSNPPTNYTKDTPLWSDEEMTAWCNSEARSTTGKEPPEFHRYWDEVLRPDRLAHAEKSYREEYHEDPYAPTDDLPEPDMRYL